MLFDTTLIIWRYIVGTWVKGGCLFWPGQWSIGITFFFFFSFCWHWSDLDAFGHLLMSGTKCESHVYRTQDWGYESKNTGLHGNSVILFTRSSGQMHISVFFQSFRFFLQSGPLSRPGWPCYDLVRLKQPWKGYQSWRVEGHSCKKRGCFTAKELDGVRKVSLQHQDVKECV